MKFKIKNKYPTDGKTGVSKKYYIIRIIDNKNSNRLKESPIGKENQSEKIRAKYIKRLL